MTFLGHLAGRLVRDHGWIKGILAVDIAGVVRRALVTTDGTISYITNNDYTSAFDKETVSSHVDAVR